MTDERLFSGACERNRQPIANVLTELMSKASHVLEVASGTGMHAVYLAPRLPHLSWQPTDVSEPSLLSIEAWAQSEPSPNLLAAKRLDITEPNWWQNAAFEGVDGVFNANMIHIAPWACAEGLMEGAGRLLPDEAPLVLYGPFKRGGQHTSPSNEGFDASLKARDPSWGVRDLETVCELAIQNGLVFQKAIEMPANNLCLHFMRTEVSA